MKRILISAAATCALLASAVFAFGDLAKPKPSPTPQEGKVVLYSGLIVAADNKAWDARLQIPAETLKDIQKAAANNGSSSSMLQSITHSSTRTMMAGLFMFLAISFAGVWLARSNQRRSAKAIAAVLVIAFALGVATVMVRANAGPPGYIRWQNLTQNLKDGKETTGGVDIEIVPGDGQIKLIMPLRNKNKPGE
jgi:cytochrome bd-type quinol oxidase subunit 1